MDTGERDMMQLGHCEQCDTLVSYRLDRGEWAIHWRRTYRPDEVTPLNMPKRYRKMWGDWIADTPRKEKP